jgi:hypothetical protein
VKADFSVSTLSVSTARRLSVGLVGAALVGSALSSTPAQAMSTPDAPRIGAQTADHAKECLKGSQRATKWHREADTTDVSAAVKAKVEKELAATAATLTGQRSASLRQTAAALPTTIHVPVFIHVIHGTHRGEKRINKRKAHRMFRTLKGGYAGDQNSTMSGSGVKFDLRTINITRNDKWFHATPFSRPDRQMKKKLHRGKAKALNIYVNRPKLRGLLGFSLLPWQRAAHPKLDGVTISEISLPGGRAINYNRGDTVIHETGHWLGLLHPFEGECSEPNDYVADTPEEGTYTTGCPEGKDTCKDADPTVPAELDPIHNFMDYSYDSCMNHFTPGQVVRMKTAFLLYRARR